MKKGKAAGPTGIVLEMFMADKDCNVDLLTSLYNLIAQGKIPVDWKSSILLPVFEGKGDQWNVGHTERRQRFEDECRKNKGNVQL